MTETDARPYSLPLLVFAVPAAVLLLHAFYYFPYFVDDAFISLRYSQRLIEGFGLTWNDGDALEGYSNFLFVILAAGLGKLGFDLVSAARLICIMGSLATLLAFAYPFRPVSLARRSAILFGGLAFALMAPVAIWTVGGMECSLLMALLVWSYVLGIRLLSAPDKKIAVIIGLLLGCVCLTRPEGALFTMAMAGGLFLFVTYPRRQALGALAILCIIPFGFFCAQEAFRIFYYHDVMPNTFYVKVALTYARLVNGFMYCFKALASFLPLLLIIALKSDKLFRDPLYAAARRPAMLLGFISLVWIVMLTVGGGDFFPGYRHILPVVPALILVTIDAMEVMFSYGSIRNTQVFLGYVLACFLWLQMNFDENVEAKTTQLSVTEGDALGHWLYTKYHDAPEKPLVAVTVAGILPYYSKLPSLDMYGLLDRYLAKHPGAEFGHGFVGHELFNNDYILSRKPEIIIFFVGKTPPLHGIEKEPEFLKNYRLEIVALPTYDAEIWVRKDSTKVNF